MMHATRITAAIAGIIILAGCGRKDRSIRFFEFAEFDLRAIDAVVVTRPPLGSRDDQTITISGVELQSLLSDLDRATVAPANKSAYSSDGEVLSLSVAAEIDFLDAEGDIVGRALTFYPDLYSIDGSPYVQFVSPRSPFSRYFRPNP